MDSAAPFIANWEIAPAGAGVFDARLVLDDESPFAGHYPGRPVLPGTFQIEALFQAAATALGGSWRLEEIVSCRFHAPLSPHDVVQARLTITEAEGGARLVEASAKASTEAAEVRLRLAPADRPLEKTPEAPPDVRPGLTWEQAKTDARALDGAFLLRILPHRFPAVLVDRALLACADTSKPVLMSFKAVSFGERCYARAGPLSSFAYPATMIAESFCQSCGLLRAGSAPPGERRDETKLPVVAKLSRLRFASEVVPGEVLEHRLRLAARMPDGAVFSGETVVRSRLVMRAEKVVAAVTQAPTSSRT